MTWRFLLLTCVAITAAQLLSTLLRGQTPAAVAPGTAAGKIRVACIGDSITAGSGIAHPEVKSYPAVLQELLGEAYEVRNFGVSGATLLKNGDKPYWKQREFKAATAYNPKIVIIKLGTNDTKPQNWSHKEEFAADLAALVDHFSAQPGKPNIWLCLPAPVHQANFGINQPALEEELPMIRAVATEQHTGTIDLFTALKPHPELFRDGVHPTAEGAAIIAQTVQETLESAAAPQKARASSDGNN